MVNFLKSKALLSFFCMFTAVTQNLRKRGIYIDVKTSDLILRNVCSLRHSIHISSINPLN